MKLKRLSITLLSLSLIFFTIPLTEKITWGQTNVNAQIDQLIQDSKQQAQQGESLEAIASLQQLLTLVQQENNQELEAWSWLGLGFNHSQIQEYPQALESYKQALTIYQEINNLSGVATSLSNMGNVYVNMGKAADAINYYQQALKVYTEMGDTSGIEKTQNHIDEVNERLR
ncbi:tetratricopeptide repeat protein [Cyanothece sp. BG0011]|uniref:tetratricopeptide repeat protein n=1 Tax=Cyanothece sp. BG0011 TaxID=2082950 RepID=UPI000D1E6107|nr:tetratricopeptide repeat protein [Cyanothece sp. BG0011]